MLIVIAVLLLLFNIRGMLHAALSEVTAIENDSPFRTFLEQGLMLNEAIAQSPTDHYYQVQQIIEAADEWEEEVAIELEKRGLNG